MQDFIITANAKMDEILHALETLKDSPSKDDILSIKQQLTNLQNVQSLQSAEIEYLKRRLVNPDDGVIVKQNEDGRILERINRILDDHNKEITKIQGLEKFQSVATKALWIIFSMTTGIIGTLIVTYLNK